MNRRFLLGGFAAVACGADRSSAVAQAPQPLRFAATPTADVTYVYYGLQTGIFARHGINMDFFRTSSGATAVAAVLAGSQDIGVTGLLSLFSAHLRGIPLAIVAGENGYDSKNPSQLLQVAVDSKFRTAADLNGKTIGVPALNGLNTVAVQAWSDRNGGDYTSLKFVEIPNSALIPAIIEHRVDAGNIQYPALGLSLQQRTTRTIGDALGAIAPRFLEAAYVARRDWVTQNPGLKQRWVDGYTEATRYLDGHPAQNTQYMAQLTGITLDQAQKMGHTANAMAATAELIQPLIDAAARYGSISNAFKAEEIL